jgi:peptidylprolyl isomerase
MIGHMNRPLSSRIPFLALMILAAAVLLIGCGGSEDDGGSNPDTGSKSSNSKGADDVAARSDSYEAAPTEKLDPSKSYVVRLETDKGDIDVTVDPKQAPIAAANFVFLVKDGFYDGVKFHRVIQDFMIQTGDPLGTGTGGPGYTIEDEPVKGSYARGAVAMARTPAPDSAGSQFFIVQGSQVDLPKEYVIFGQVDKAGMKAVDEIANVEVEAGPSGEPSTPVEDVFITKATLLDE